MVGLDGTKYMVIKYDLLHILYRTGGLAHVYPQRSCGELSFRLPDQGGAAAGPDVSACLYGGCLRRAGGRRVHGCGGHGGRPVAGEARLRLRLSGRSRHGHRGRQRAVHRQQPHDHGRFVARDLHAADAAQLGRGLSGQFRGRGAHCGALCARARVFCV